MVTEVDHPWEIVQGCDAVVLMVTHDVYHAVNLGGLRMQIARPILVDERHVFSAKQAQTAGRDYHSVGVRFEQP